MRTPPRRILGVLAALALLGTLSACDRTDVSRSECLGRDHILPITGTWATDYRTNDRLPDGGVLDARTATFAGTNKWPIHLKVESGEQLCLVGGTITGLMPYDTTDWSTFHDQLGVIVRAERSTIVGTRVDNRGDAFTFGAESEGWTLRGVHVTRNHDDCVENDAMNTGLIDESLFDGCYTFLSGRSGSSTAQPDGSAKAVTITDSAVRLQPMPQVYRGPAPGHQGFWKMGWGLSAGENGIAPRLRISNTVFRVDQPASVDDLRIPTYDHDRNPATPRVSYLDPAHCSGNTIVWTGGDPARNGTDMPGAETYPSSCFRFTSDIGVWDRAVASWHAAHG